MYTIGQFARIGLVSAKTLRFYDEIGLLKPARVDNANQYRYYSHQQVTEVLRIAELKEYGFSLEEIKLLLESSDPVLLERVLESKLEELTSTVGKLSGIIARIESKLKRLKEGEADVVDLNAFSVDIKEKQPVTVVSLRRNIAISQVGSLIGELFSQLRCAPAGPVMTVYHSPDFNPEETDLEVCIPVRSGTSLPNVREIPGGPHACTIYQGPYSGIGAAYAALMEWMERNGCMCAGAPFEVYLVGPDGVQDEQKYVTEVCYPVMKK